MSPDADQEIHRDQHHFPEQEEQEQVQRNEHADHSGFQNQQRDEKAFHALVNRFPGSEDRNRREQRGQQDQKQAEPVDAQVVVNRRLRNPGAKFIQLIAGCVRIKAANQQQRNGEFDDRGGHREAANPHMVVIAQEQERSVPATGRNVRTESK